MSATGNTPNRYVWEFPGNPTNASLSIINPPKGALVVDNTTGELYIKTTGYADNSGYFAVMGAIQNAAAAANNALTGLDGKINQAGDNAALPTADPLSQNALWNDAGAVKVSSS